MMDNDEIAWVLRQLLRETRTYCCVQFAQCFTDSAEEVRYFNGLISAMPYGERLEVTASFNNIYDSVVAVRVTASIATHPAPVATQ